MAGSKRGHVPLGVGPFLNQQPSLGDLLIQGKNECDVGSKHRVHYVQHQRNLALVDSWFGQLKQFERLVYPGVLKASVTTELLRTVGKSAKDYGLILQREFHGKQLPEKCVASQCAAVNSPDPNSHLSFWVST